jgi:hypothetical protein
LITSLIVALLWLAIRVRIKFKEEQKFNYPAMQAVGDTLIAVWLFKRGWGIILCDYRPESSRRNVTMDVRGGPSVEKGFSSRRH